MAHNEPPHLDLHCLPFLSSNSPCEIALMKHIFKFCWLKSRHLLFKVLHGVLRNKLETVSAESADDNTKYQYTQPGLNTGTKGLEQMSRSSLILPVTCERYHSCSNLALKGPKLKVKFANSIDLDEVAQDKPPHLDLHCLPSS